MKLIHIFLLKSSLLAACVLIFASTAPAEGRLVGTATASGPSLGIHSSMQYTIEVPKAGDYTLSAKVATPNVNQSLQLAVNGTGSPTTMELPFTIGMWETSKPVTVTLKPGTNTLHLWRDKAPQYGVALKEFTLKPVEGNR
jgi:hypothetical protein